MRNDDQTPHSSGEIDTSSCRVRKITDELMDCLVEKSCAYALPFGNGKFCRHPLKQQIADNPAVNDRQS